jgi:hypothetical protein
MQKHKYVMNFISYATRIIVTKEGGQELKEMGKKKSRVTKDIQRNYFPQHFNWPYHQHS